MSEESKTPRTDEQEFNDCCGYEVDWTNFARQLETELAEERSAHARTKQRRQQIDDEACSYSEQLTYASSERDQWKAIAERLANAFGPFMLTRIPYADEVREAEQALADLESLRKEGE